MTPPGSRPRAVRVRTDVAALTKLFDYVVPERWADDITVGARVRVALHGRRVGGWVVDDDVTPPPGIEPLPLKGWSGWGPPPAVLELAEWAAWRWAGPVPFFLGVASPSSPVRRLPPVPEIGPSTSGVRPGAEIAADAGPDEAITTMAASALRREGSTLLRLPPTTDLIDLVQAVVNDPETAARPGSVLILVPSVGWAERLRERLVRRGYMATSDWAHARAGWPIVVGSRAAAWAPLPRLSAALVLDAHDESYREESAPTYSAVDVVTERARREGVPCIVTSPCPPTVVAAGRATDALAPSAERAGWSTIEYVDRRGADPRSGMFSEEFVRLAHAVLDDPEQMAQSGPLVCFYDRTGRARLLACAACGDLAQCTFCSAAVAAHGSGLLCPRCGLERPMVCASCGRLRMKTLRAWVSRLREEVAALLGVEVGEVSGPAVGGASGDRGAVPATPVLMGTEAVFHRVRRASAVVFLDIDIHLLAPRFSATDETVTLLARASRLVGPRRYGLPSARVLVQTRVPDDPILQAVGRGDLVAVAESEEAMRRSAELPPFSSLAAVTGPLAPDYVEGLREVVGARRGGAGISRDGAVSRDGGDSAGPVRVSELPDGGYLLQAPDHGALSDLLAVVPRPAGRGLRVAVDPTTI